MERHLHVRSMSGELIEVIPLLEFAAIHDMEPRRLLAELLLAQAVVGRDPAFGAGWRYWL